MTDFRRRHNVGITSVLRRCAACAALTVPTFAGATSFNQTWFEFEQRCLIPFEDFAPPLVADLPRMGDDAYQLPGGAVLTLTGETVDGARSCIVEGAGLVKGFDTWRSEALATGRYIESDTPGYFLSHEWIEPVIAVERQDRAVRVVETELES